MSDPADRIRLDKWLWHARFFKTRGLATGLVRSGKVRVNGDRVDKASTMVGPGDTLTFPQGRRVRVVRLVATSTRRGPATEAQTLYDDLTEPEDSVPRAPGFEGKGRPTKRDRRALDLSRREPLD